MERGCRYVADVKVILLNLLPATSDHKKKEVSGRFAGFFACFVPPVGEGGQAKGMTRTSRHFYSRLKRVLQGVNPQPSSSVFCGLAADGIIFVP